MCSSLKFVVCPFAFSTEADLAEPDCFINSYSTRFLKNSWDASK